MRVFFLTLTPSPHIQENLNAIGNHDNVELVVGFETLSLGSRTWGRFFPDCKTVDLKSRKIRGMSSLYSPNLKKALGQIEPDVIVIGSSMWSPNSWVARSFARSKNIPFFIFSEAPNQQRSNWFRWIRKHVGRRYFSLASGFLGVTEQVCSRLATLYSFKGPTLPFPYHRDLSSFIADTRTRPENKPLCLLFVGTLDENKNAKLIIDALEFVSKPVQLDILGDGRLKSSLMSQSQKLSSGRVNFHGNIPYEKVADFMCKADFLVLPSRHDGFGMVVMEALTIGLPVIASDGVCSAVEYVVPGRNGWLFLNDDKENLQEVISLAISDIANWESYSVRAAEIGDVYNVRLTSQRFVDLAMSAHMERTTQ